MTQHSDLHNTPTDSQQSTQPNLNSTPNADPQDQNFSENFEPSTPLHDPQDHKFTESLLNITLVFIESILSLILRFSPKLRQAAYPLAQHGTLVCVRSYLPHLEIFITFTYKGILLDNQLPPHKTQADVTINAYSVQILQALFSNNPKILDDLQIIGEEKAVDWVENFLLTLGIENLLQDLITKFKPDPQQKDAEKAQKREQTQQKTAQYRQKIAEQEEQIQKLTLDNQKLTIQLKEAQSKIKILYIVLMGVVLLRLISWLFV